MPAPSASEPVRVALLGYGTVGSSVDRLLREHSADLQRVVGRPVEVVRALVRDAQRPREGARDGLLTERFEDILEDDGIACVAEVMGGVEPTRGYLQALLERGVPVVSANKQLLARHGQELLGAAERGRAQLRFEASVCAAIPVVKVLRESLLASDVSEVLGIVNGTTNFILSAMANEGAGYAEALAQAQALGYAEADPTEDVGGADAAAKLAILASIAFHAHVGIDDVPFEGIDSLDGEDVAAAKELGYAVKLLAHAQLGEDGIAASVGPTLVPRSHTLAAVEGSFNAVMLRGTAIRQLTLQGPGAGGDETATAVIGDLLSAIGTSGTGFAQHDGYYRTLPRARREDRVTPLYLRLEAEDRPGVLAQIAGTLGAHGVSIQTMIQRPSAAGGASLVLLLHPARLGDAERASAEIAALDLCRSQPRLLRVLGDG